MSYYFQGDENDATTLPDDDEALFDDEDFVEEDDVEARMEEIFADEEERIRDPDVTPEALEPPSESEEEESESPDEEVSFPKKVPKKKSSVNLRRLSQEEIDSYTNGCADNESNEITTVDILMNQETLDLDERQVNLCLSKKCNSMKNLYL